LPSHRRSPHPGSQWQAILHQKQLFIKNNRFLEPSKRKPCTPRKHAFSHSLGVFATKPESNEIEAWKSQKLGTIKRVRKRKATPCGHKRQVEIAVPVFGYKNHVGIDREHGFVRRYSITHAAAWDGGQLGAVLDRGNTARDVWADTAYRSAANPALLDRRGLPAEKAARQEDAGAHRPWQRHPRPGAIAGRHVFAARKCRLRLVVRTIGMVRARVKIGLANLAYNFTRLAWLNEQAVPA
jgi:transposase, IS5 family